MTDAVPAADGVPPVAGPPRTSGGPDGTDVPLRELGTADVRHLVALEEQLFGVSAWSEPMIREELAAPGRWYVGAPDPAGGLLGYAGLWFDGDVAQVMTIGVAPGAQRRGLGSALLAALVDRARALGAEAVLLEVRVDNDPALRLYERFGFVVLARRKRYYQPEDVDAWTMRLTLDGPRSTGSSAAAYPGTHA